MLYLYDDCIVKDLKRSFNPENVENPAVRVIDPEGIIGLAAQIQDDNITFPVVALSRSDDISIDTELTNFTRMHRGVTSVLDPETNNLYYEKVVPIKLSYKMTILTTNTADMDEIVRELIFKYLQMYFLSMQLPYECKRTVRFGVVIDPDSIERTSGTFEYIQSGQLYQTVLTLKVEGAVLVSYTKAKLTNIRVETEVKT